MVIKRSKLTNPFIKAYVEIMHIPDGGNMPVTEYMAWFNEKEDRFRKQHGIEAGDELTQKQKKELVSFLWMK